MNALQITKDNFEQEVAAADKPVLVDFWADWCGPCKMIGPVVDELAEENADKIKVGKINVDDEPELAQQYGVMSIPTLILFKEGEAVSQVVGAQPKEVLEEMINS